MAVRIRLMRMGKIRNPQYRIVVADSRTKRDGKAIENLGIYHPKEEPSRIEVNSDRVQYWLSVGAQPSDPVLAILRKTGDWQKFKGLTPPANPVKVAPAKADRHAIYEAEAKAAAGLADKPGKGEADQPAKKAGQKAAKQQRRSGSQASPDATKQQRRSGSQAAPDSAAKPADKPAEQPASESAEPAAAEPAAAEPAAAEPAVESDASEQS